MLTFQTSKSRIVYLLIFKVNQDSQVNDILLASQIPFPHSYVKFFSDFSHGQKRQQDDVIFKFQVKLKFIVDIFSIWTMFHR